MASEGFLPQAPDYNVMVNNNLSRETKKHRSLTDMFRFPW